MAQKKKLTASARLANLIERGVGKVKTQRNEYLKKLEKPTRGGIIVCGCVLGTAYVGYCRSAKAALKAYTNFCSNGSLKSFPLDSLEWLASQMEIPFALAAKVEDAQILRKHSVTIIVKWLNEGKFCEYAENEPTQ